MASGPPFPPPYNPNPQDYPPYPRNPQSEYQWLAPATLSGPGQPSDWPGQPKRPAMYELRPLSTGEVLDRTFSLFRSHFLLFAGIASLAAVVRLIGTAGQLSMQATILRGGTINGFGLTNNLVSLGASIVFLLAFAVTQAATMWAVGEVYLGREAAIGTSLRAVLPLWLRYVGIALWQTFSMSWPALAVLALFGIVWLLNGRSFGATGSAVAIGLLIFLLLCAFVLGFIFYLRNLLGVPVAVSEGLGVRAAMRRSKALSQGAKGKLFLVLLIAGALYMVMMMILSITTAIVLIFHHGVTLGTFATGGNLILIGAVTLIVVFFGYAIISPVIMIGVSLVYFDQRVRKEAFDVAVLLEEETFVAAEAGVSVPAATVEAVQLSMAEAPSPAEPWPEDAPLAEPPGGASGI